MANEKRTIEYYEPADYFPKSLRKKYKMGEYATDESKSSASKKKKGTKK